MTGTALPRHSADEYGVDTGVYYPIPSHRLRSLGARWTFPKLSAPPREVLSLPVILRCPPTT